MHTASCRQDDIGCTKDVRNFLGNFLNPQFKGRGLRLFLKDDEDEAERGIDNGGDSLFPLSTVVTVDPMNVVSSILTVAALRSCGGGGLFAVAAAASSCSSLISRRRGSEIVWAMKLTACDSLIRQGRMQYLRIYLDLHRCEQCFVIAMQMSILKLLYLIK